MQVLLKMFFAHGFMVEDFDAFFDELSEKCPDFGGGVLIFYEKHVSSYYGESSVRVPPNQGGFS